MYFRVILICLVLTSLASCNGQVRKDTPPQQSGNSTAAVGGPFENREFTYIGMPGNITATDTSAGWTLAGQKLLLTGIVYQPDASTPAPGVLIYYYQTNTDGKYVHKADVARSMPPNAGGQTHGYIRGWVRTDQQGRYSIYTVRPASYPGSDEPAHIHVTIKEPNDLPEYWIDDFLFDDDPFLTPARRQRLPGRAGSGILQLERQDSLWIGRRNMVLGQNIPAYPDNTNGNQP